ncbi:MAG TPA: M56 family metallopeptidase [Actinopolymorphaceae bacterium]|jgi:Zn-dependent protease with chaperone function
MTPVILAGLGLLLAGPVAGALARATWPAQVPRAAIVLWQSISLAAVLAVLGAGLSLGLRIVTHPSPSTLEIVAHLLVMALTLLVLARLVWASVRVAVRTRAARRRHRMLVDLLASHDGTDGAERQAGSCAHGIREMSGLRILSEPTPLAYCLPGLGRSRVVLSDGTLDHLDRAELEAVLAHERAHLRARHDLVVEAFTALCEAFPRLVRSRTTLQQTRLLIEMLADDAARRRVGAGAVARALVTLAGARPPEPVAGLAASGQGTVARVRRLAEPEASRPVLSMACYLASAAILGLPTVAVAVPWLAGVVEALAR